MNMKSTGTAYLLWLVGLIGICGIHRIYAGRTLSGVIWLLTFGILGWGQLIDLFLIPSMVDYANTKSMAKVALSGQANSNTSNIVVNVANPTTDQSTVMPAVQVPNN